MSFIGYSVNDLPSPAYVVDLKVLRQNCDQMLKRAQENGLKLRGQTKTHKTVEGGLLQTGGTKRGLVTSTLVESEMYADAGFDDILYGYPLLEQHMERNRTLAARLESYHMMVTNMQTVEVLLRHEPPKGKKWSVFLKMDCGNARAGFDWDDQGAVEVALKIKENAEKIHFEGLYVHCGNSYATSSVEEVTRVRDQTIQMLTTAAERFRAAGIEVPHIGTGSTPCCSHSGPAWKQLTEMHPGNYVLYDYQQVLVGSCSPSDVAGLVMTRVLGHQPQRNQVIVDCGFTALTKQGYEHQGEAFAFIKGHPDLKLSNMTQEIGFLEPKDASENIDISKLPVGTELFLYPYHACATAAMHEKYFIHEDGVVTGVWEPCRGW